MKLCTGCLIASVLLVVAAPAGAAVQHEVAVAAGASVPYADFADQANTGVNLGAQYQMLFSRYGFGGEIKFHSWGASRETKLATESTYGPGAEKHFAAWQYDVYGIVTMPMQGIRPYVKLGAGYYAPNTRIESPTLKRRQWDIGFSMLAGVGFDLDNMGPVKFGMGVAHHRIKDTERDFTTVSARVTWPLNLGLVR